MGKRCLRCNEVYIDENIYAEQLKEYIESIPEEIKTPPVKYSRRLNLCHACGNLNGGICSACGCFVEMRAAKEMMYCPYKKW